MARRGPAEPRVTHGDAALGGADHVACRRLGGGLAGDVADSNARAGMQAALALEPTVVLLEGSGATLPPFAATRAVCLVDARHATDALDLLGSVRLLRADLVVLTGAGAVGSFELAVLRTRLERFCGAGVEIVASALLVEQESTLVTAIRPALEPGGEAAIGDDVDAALDRLVAAAHAA